MKEFRSPAIQTRCDDHQKTYHNANELGLDSKESLR